MKKIVFLTMKDIGHHIPDDDLLKEELEKMGHQVSYRSWEDLDKEIKDEDFFIIRTTWNYTDHLDHYLEKLSLLGDKLWNPLPLVKWNCHKKYLLELEENGVKIIPFKIVASQAELRIAMDELGGDEFVIKPPVGASAIGLQRFKKNRQPEFSKEMMVQKFLPEITRGENSLIFCAGEFKYALKKTPKPGDIRVQEEYGSSIDPYNPTEAELENARLAIKNIPHPWLYARVDMVSGHGVIELECIEPALYFARFPGSAEMMAETIVNALKIN